MAKKSDYSLFIIFFFNLLEKYDYSLIFRPSLFTIHYFLGSLFTIHYKKGHYSLIIIPQPDPHRVFIKITGIRDQTPSNLVNFLEQRTITPESIVQYGPLSTLKETS